MPGRQPGEQFARLRLLRAAVGQRLDEFAGGAAHPPLVLHRDPQVIEDTAQVCGEALLVRYLAELDVDPRLADRPVAGQGDRVRRAGHVPAHDEHRVHDQPDVGGVPVELHRHRVDQVRHVVGDDVDDGPGGGERAADPGARLGRADADDRTALRAGRAERGLPGGRLGQPIRAGRDQVLKGHPPVIRGQEGEPVADS